MDSETSRVEAFSDGVFAIAITLLILEIKVPPVTPEPLTVLLLRQWPSYVAFLLSFAFIGIMWMNHHRLFTHIRHCDHALLVLNLLLLLGVSAVPFPTAVLASRLGRQDARVAAALYNGTYLCIAIVFNLLWRYAASSHRLLGKNADRAAVDQITRQYAFGPLMYAVCLAVGWYSVAASLALNVALALFFAIPGRQRARSHSAEA